MGVLVSGSVIAKLIGVLATPIITRLFTPEDYGLMALFVALVSVVMPIMTLRYVVAIPLPKRDSLAVNVLGLSFFLALIVGALATIVLYSWGDKLLTQAGMQGLTPYKPLIIVGLLGGALYEMFSLWAVRRKDYKLLAKTSVRQSLMAALTKIVSGLIGLKPLGLILGNIVSMTGGLGFFIRSYFAEMRKLLVKCTMHRMWFLAKYYLSVPMYRLPSQMLLVSAKQLPIIAFGLYYSATVVGQFALAMMIIKMPVQLISSNASKAYYGEIASLNSVSKIGQVSRSLLKRLLLIFLPINVIAFLFAPIVFPVVFGNQWVIAGDYAQLLTVYMTGSALAVVYSPLLNVLNNQKAYLAINVCRTALIVLSFWLSVTWGLSAYQAVAVYCLAMFIFQYSNVGWYFWIMRQGVFRQ